MGGGQACFASAKNSNRHNAMRTSESYGPSAQASALPPSKGAGARSLGVAEILELGAGLFQTFGLGHFYAGNWRTGIMLMTSYWFALMANMILVPFFIGVFSLPLTWLIFAAVSTQQLFAYAHGRPDRFD